MIEILMGVAALAAVGCVAGLLAGLLGVGGGTILVPALVAYGHYFYDGRISNDIIMHMALGTSLAIIIPTGMSSAWAQIKRKAVDWDALKRLVPGLMAGVVVGIFIAAQLGSHTLQIIFAVSMYCMLGLILKKPKPEHVYPKLLSWPVVLPVTGGVGILATLVGIGGSILNIPYMAYAGLPLHRAIATGSVLGVIVSIPAAIGFVIAGLASNHALPIEFLGYLNMKAWICIVPFSIFLAPFGVKLSHRLDVNRLRQVFACFVFIVATKMLWDVLHASA